MTGMYTSRGASIAFQGFTTAIETIAGEDPSENQIALGQALFWGITLDELLMKAFPKSYERTRDGDPNGIVVDGARLARNAITHGAVVVQSIQGGLEYPLTYPLKFGSPAWTPLDQLLSSWTPEPRARLPIQKQSYSAHFATRPGREPLARFRTWLAGAASHGFVL